MSETRCTDCKRRRPCGCDVIDDYLAGRRRERPDAPVRRRGCLAVLLAFLAGCVPHAAPPVYPEPLPDYAPPGVAELPPAGDDACPLVAPLLPGRPPPYVQDGAATCRAQVVPEARVLELVQAADLGAYWQTVGESCVRWRAVERAHCEAVAGQRWEHAEELRAEGRALRWAVVGGVVGGLLLGAAVGVAAAEVAP